jgi:hypothetical protein
VTYVLPLALTFTASPLPIALGVLAWAIMTVCYAPVIRFYDLEPQWSLTLPLVAALLHGRYDLVGIPILVKERRRMERTGAGSGNSRDVSFG